ncbi:Gm4707 [Phodopus roborovskii]|uniref:Gm4707 protein n=1 Tax=Phodopus roborovskii TaxID=109678 RepID=A0AAU9YQ83_PHORO|nr:Gm4707 [Phodopus roborovskii]
MVSPLGCFGGGEGWAVVLIFFFFFFFFFCQDRVSVCSPGCPGTHSVDQAGLELREPTASASQLLGLKVCATAIW